MDDTETNGSKEPHDSTDPYTEMPYEQLKKLHRHIGAILIAKRREALDALKAQLTALGFSPDDLWSKKTTPVKNNAPKYRDPDNQENTWSGRGRKPTWLTDALDQGRQLEEFAI